MSTRKMKLMIDTYDQDILFQALNALRNRMMKEERPTDPVDDLMLRVHYAGTLRGRVSEGRRADEEYR